MTCWVFDIFLDLGGSIESLALLLSAHLGLGTHDTTTPLLAGLLVLVHETVLDGGDELGELGLVLRADLGKSEDSSGLSFESVIRSCDKFRLNIPSCERRYRDGPCP